MPAEPRPPAPPSSSLRLRPRPRERRFFGRFVRTQHRLALAFGRILEARPPVDEILRHFAGRAAQRQEVVGRAEALVLEQAIGTRAGALLEARLQSPDLLDVGLEAARHGDALRLRGQHAIHRVVERGQRLVAASLGGGPLRQHLVPEQGREEECGRYRLALAHARVGAGQRHLDEARAERLLEDHVEQRQEAVREAVRAQALQRLGGVTRQQELLHLVEQACGRHVLHEARKLGDGRRGLGIDGEPRLGGEAHRAQHPHGILAIARDRRADELQAAGAAVGHAADVVPDLLGRRIEVERIDREVAPRGILGLRAVHVVGEEASVLVGGLLRLLRRAEGGHLEHLGARVDVHQAEAPADDVGPAEERLDLLRRGVGRDVEVLGREAQEEIADRAAHHEGLESRLLQLFGHLARAARHLFAAHGVIGRRIDARGARRPAGNQACEQAADHCGGEPGRRVNKRLAIVEMRVGPACRGKCMPRRAKSGEKGARS